MAEECLRAFPVLRSRVRQFDENFRGEILTLAFIVGNGGGMSPGELSSALAVSSARVAVTLNGLESKGFITRRIDPADRRHVIVDPTPEGTAEARRNYHTMVRRTSEILQRLGEEDALAITRVIGRLAGLAPDGDRA